MSSTQHLHSYRMGGSSLSLEQMLELSMSPESLPYQEELVAHEPVKVGPTNLERIAKWIMITGGVTFIAFSLKYIFTYIVFLYDLEWGVYIVLKLECLLSHLAWYWISYDEHLRLTTDARFLALARWIFTCCIWPHWIQSWAEQLDT